VNRVHINKETLAAADCIANIINSKCTNKKALAEKVGISRNTLNDMTVEPYKFGHLSTYIEVFKALGMNEVTIRW